MGDLFQNVEKLKFLSKNKKKQYNGKHPPQKCKTIKSFMEKSALLLHFHLFFLYIRIYNSQEFKDQCNNAQLL